MRWIALLAATLVGSAALLLLLVFPSSSGLPASGFRASANREDLAAQGVLPVRREWQKEPLSEDDALLKKAR